MAEKILIDTDLGSDCDDAGALALLHNMAEEGMAKTIGITHCASEISGAIALKVINEWYKRSDIPIGRLTRYKFLEGEKCTSFTKKTAESYIESHEIPRFEDSVKVMRKALVENTGVTLVTIGMMNNVADLLRSEPDEISDKNGLELVRDSVRCMYSMGGNFKDFEYEEYNIKTDVKSANYVAAHFPAPIIYAGFELGCDIKTGNNLKNGSDENPVRKMYDILGGLGFSWDPITAYCAIRQENKFFDKNSEKTISFDDRGRTICTDGGKDFYLVMTAELEAVRAELDKYIR